MYIQLQNGMDYITFIQLRNGYSCNKIEITKKDIFSFGPVNESVYTARNVGNTEEFYVLAFMKIIERNYVLWGIKKLK